ncbi:hypothetical protein FACS1894217_15490 [Clostridia bacterium]|nr:hypothetical protein FACS1894217_15490 [Clostridia bacterium]
MPMLLAHMSHSQAFLDTGQLTVELLGKTQTIVPAEYWKQFCITYNLFSAVAFYMLGWMIYRAIIEPLLTGRRKGDPLREEDMKAPPFPWKKDKFQLILGLKHNKFTTDYKLNPEWTIIPEKALYQNILMTGTIGTGKTASFMYPACKQALFYQADKPDEKAGMLILDVKGNFYEQVLKYAAECGREDDVVLITLGGKYTYNPLHKPGMEPVDLAERSRQVLNLISGGGGNAKDSFWNTKSAAMIGECIRLMRLVNDGYVSLGHVHDLVTNSEYLEEQLYKLKYLIGDEDEDFPEEQDEEAIEAAKFFRAKNDFDIRMSDKYFKGEFTSKAETTIETIKACVTELTSFFASSQAIHESFCPEQEALNFFGFEDVINDGKIVVFAMNVAGYPRVRYCIGQGQSSPLRVSDNTR